MLEGPLADRSDPGESWISDLGARSESTALIFDLLDVASGVATMLLAYLLLRSFGSGSRMLRQGVIALGTLGALTVIDGAFPLSCAEALDPSCEIEGDAIDVVHGIESNLAILALIAAFYLLGRGLRREGGVGRWAGPATIALGVAWLVLTFLMIGGHYPLGDDGAANTGTFHRASQLALGAWLVLLGWVGSARPTRS